MKHFNKKLFPGLGSLSKPKKTVDQKTELTEEVNSIIKLYQEEMAKASEKYIGQPIESVDWAKVPFKEPTAPSKWVGETPSKSFLSQLSPAFMDLLNSGLGAELFDSPYVVLNKAPPSLIVQNPCGEVVIGAPEVNKLPPPEENMGLSISGMKKTKPKKHVKKPKPLVKPTEIFQWQMHSKKEVAGVKATYTTILRSDGTLACNCPGWVFKKKGQDERRCKHTDLVEIESKEMFKKWKKGEKLGEPMVESVPISNAPSHKPVLPTTKYGRVIDIE